MNRFEFLAQLEEQLRGAVSAQEVRESVQYYQSYIEEEMRKGRTEEEIFDDIGSANSVAKAIIEAKGHGADSGRIYDETEYSSDDGQEQYSDGYEGRQSNDSRVKVFRTDGWKGTLILVGILIVIIMLLSFAFRIFVSLLPVLIPFALILFLIRTVTGRR